MVRRKILEVIPRKIEKEERKPKEKRKIEQITGEKNYKWCEGAELPVITVIFKNGKIIEERTNDEIVIAGE